MAYIYSNGWGSNHDMFCDGFLRHHRELFTCRLFLTFDFFPLCPILSTLFAISVGLTYC